jgi:hypothetical protein
MEQQITPIELHLIKLFILLIILNEDEQDNQTEQ